MAKKPTQNPADVAKAASKLSELKGRIMFLVGALIVFRAGTYIPVPGVDPAALAAFFDQQAGNILGLFNLFSGGALSRFGIFALGIMPYISSSIIMQMASMVVPTLQQLRKEGEAGKRRITQYTRYGTVGLSLFQSIAAATWLQSQPGVVVNPGTSFLITACITLVTGTMFLMCVLRNSALGIMPYISSSIIMQMASMVVPTLQQLRKEGEAGKRRITQYTRYGTVGLSLFQSIAAATWLQSQPGVVVNPGTSFLITACITLVTGTMFLMWLGEQITERGVGNGISMIILAGIVAGVPAAVAGTAELVRNGEMPPATAILMLIGALAVTTFVVYMERAQRRITVNYARRQQGRKMYAAQSTHLPFKINMSGVIPSCIIDRYASRHELPYYGMHHARDRNDVPDVAG